jgi:hypothetical protein
LKPSKRPLWVKPRNPKPFRNVRVSLLEQTLAFV